MKAVGAGFATDFYTIGKTWRRDIPSDVEHQADRDLSGGLGQGKSCDVLMPNSGMTAYLSGLGCSEGRAQL